MSKIPLIQKTLEDDAYCDACGHTSDQSQSTSALTDEESPLASIWYGLSAAQIFGVLSYFIVYFFVGDFTMKKMGAVLFLIVPLSCGATLGYFIRPIHNTFWRAFISLLVAAILAALIYVSNVSGFTCAGPLAAIFVVPLYVGVVFGRLFRLWSAWHVTGRFQLPALVLFFVLPIVYGAFEERDFELTPICVVETQFKIEAPRSAVRRTVQFSESIAQDLV